MTIPEKSPAFPDTSWSTISRLSHAEPDDSCRAFSKLCEIYWYPLYAYFRRSGKSPHDAEDLTQGLFARFQDRNVLISASPEKGRLRTFLLACARNHMTDEWSREMAQKRSGGTLHGFDPEVAEQRFVQEPADEMSPDRLFQKRWALAILESSLSRLEEEYRTPAQREMFEALRPFLGFGDGAEHRYEDIASRLQIPVGTLKNRVFRMRQRWRELLFEQVGRTLENPDPEEIKSELMELLGAV